MLYFSICLIASSIEVNSIPVTMEGGCDTPAVTSGAAKEEVVWRYSPWEAVILGLAEFPRPTRRPSG
jgi:hypothetical protein